MTENKYPKLQIACSGLSPVGAVIKDSYCIYILFEEDCTLNKAGDYTSQVVSYYPRMTGVWTLAKYGGFKNLQGVIDNDGRLLVCGMNGAVLIQNNEFDDTEAPTLLFEFPVSSKKIKVTRTRSIAGTVFVVTKGQGVYRRIGIERWACMLQNTSAKFKDKNAGFTDISGLSENNLYACGGRGVLWHFDGADWEVIEMPEGLSSEGDLYFQTICCSPDGSVYIGCRSGEIIYGKSGKWTSLAHKAPTKIIDMINYQGKLFIACGKKGLHVYDGSHLAPANAKNDVVNPLNTANTLSTDGNILVVTGKNRVHTFDGIDWKLLYAPVSPS